MDRFVSRVPTMLLRSRDAHEYIKNQFVELYHDSFLHYLVHNTRMKIRVVVEYSHEPEGPIPWHYTLQCDGVWPEIEEERLLDENNDALTKSFRENLEFFFWVFFHEKLGERQPKYEPYITLFLQRLYPEAKKFYVWSSFIKDMIMETYPVKKQDLVVQADFIMNRTKAFWQAFNHCFSIDIILLKSNDLFSSLSKKIYNVYTTHVENLIRPYENTEKTTLLNYLSDLYKLIELIRLEVLEDKENSIYVHIREDEFPDFNRLVHSFEDRLRTIKCKIENKLSEMIAAEVDEIFQLNTYHKVPNRVENPTALVTNIIEKIQHFQHELEGGELPVGIKHILLGHYMFEFSIRYQRLVIRLLKNLKTKFPKIPKRLNYLSKLNQQIDVDTEYYLNHIPDIPPKFNDFIERTKLIVREVLNSLKQQHFVFCYL